MRIAIAFVAAMLAIAGSAEAQVMASPKAADLGADSPGVATAAELIEGVTVCNAKAVTPEQPPGGRLRVAVWGGTPDEIAACEAIASEVAKRRAATEAARSDPAKSAMIKALAGRLKR